MASKSELQVSATALSRLWGGSLVGVTIGVWGLEDQASFSALSGAPRELVAALLEAGASVQVYAPGVDRLDGAYVAPDGYDAARDADALIVFANQSDLREVDFAKVHEVMTTPRLLDAGGALDADEMRSLGFELLQTGSAAPASGSQNNRSDNVRRLDDKGQGVQHASTGMPAKPMVRGLKGKRALDLLLGVPLAFAAIPLIAVFAIGIAISFRCWPFFTQWRTGQDGKNFRFLKIRSLPPKTPAYANKFDLDQKSLPWLAGFLRKQHLDELPQLLLVPLGKMSLVGPRPKMPDDHEPIDPTFGQLRTLVPQGCTGLWQIGEHAHLRVCDSADYDYAYLTFGGVRFDLWILWRTALLLIGRNTAISLAKQGSIPGWVRGRGFLSEDAELRMIIAAADQEALNTVAA